MLKYVVVRTFSAGVHYGELVSREGKEVTLRSAKRIWSWKGANTLNEIASFGVGEGSKVSKAVDEIVLTEAIEIITCSPDAVRVLESAKWG